MNVSADEFQLSCEGALLEPAHQINALSCCELDLTVPLLGGKVHGSLARAGKYIAHPNINLSIFMTATKNHFFQQARSRAKHQKWRNKRKRRRRQDAQRDVSSTIADSSMLYNLSVADVVQMLILHKCFDLNQHSKPCTLPLII